MGKHSVQMIFCENPQQWIWEQYQLLENEMTARELLEKKYNQIGVTDPARAAFRNVQSFVSYIKQAKAIFTETPHTLWTEPFLLYYGAMALMKALVLTREAHYPASATVLRHGLSTRKRKKQTFQFFQDEVRVQREGLFGLVCELIQHPPLGGESFVAKELFGVIPELQTRYTQMFGSPSLLPIKEETRMGIIASRTKGMSADTTEDTTADLAADVANREGIPLSLSSQVLDELHLTPSAFIGKLNMHASPLWNESERKIMFFENLQEPGNEGEETTKQEKRRENGEDNEKKNKKREMNRIHFSWNADLPSDLHHWTYGLSHPWIYRDTKGQLYLWVNKGLCSSTPPCELLSHYMLLFSLSMLCRYETTLWGGIINAFDTQDSLLIQPFLTHTRRKFPHMILEYILEERIILWIR